MTFPRCNLIWRFLLTTLLALCLVSGISSAPVRAQPKSDIWAPALSLLLPGFDQWWEQDYGAAAAYSGMWLGGNALAVSGLKALQGRQDLSGSDRLSSRDGDVRRAMLGSQMAFAAGSYSTLHAFRNAVDSRREFGQYSFLGEKVSVQDTVMAPFHFSYLKSPNTYIPLGLIGALAVYTSQSHTEGYERVALRNSDVAFGGAFSYLAGTHEEALFRGWMMPLMREYVAGDTMSNVSQSLLFALAHRSTVAVPIPQLLLGYHLGYVTQQNGWSLGEAVFIHTWWDIFAFLASYSQKEIDQGASQRIGRTVFKTPVLNLPPLSLVF